MERIQAIDVPAMTTGISDFIILQQTCESLLLIDYKTDEKYAQIRAELTNTRNANARLGRSKCSSSVCVMCEMHLFLPRNSRKQPQKRRQTYRADNIIDDPAPARPNHVANAGQASVPVCASMSICQEFLDGKDSEFQL